MTPQSLAPPPPVGPRGPAGCGLGKGAQGLRRLTRGSPHPLGIRSSAHPAPVPPLPPPGRGQNRGCNTSLVLHRLGPCNGRGQLSPRRALGRTPLGPGCPRPLTPQRPQQEAEGHPGQQAGLHRPQGHGHRRTDGPTTGSGPPAAGGTREVRPPALGAPAPPAATAAWAAPGLRPEDARFHRTSTPGPRALAPRPGPGFCGLFNSNSSGNRTRLAALPGVPAARPLSLCRSPRASASGTLPPPYKPPGGGGDVTYPSCHTDCVSSPARGLPAPGALLAAESQRHCWNPIRRSNWEENIFAWPIPRGLGTNSTLVLEVNPLPLRQERRALGVCPWGREPPFQGQGARRAAPGGRGRGAGSRGQEVQVSGDHLCLQTGARLSEQGGRARLRKGAGCPGSRGSIGSSTGVPVGQAPVTPTMAAAPRGPALRGPSAHGLQGSAQGSCPHHRPVTLEGVQGARTSSQPQGPEHHWGTW